MRRKWFAVIYIVVLSMGTILSLYIPKQQAASKETVIIPKSAIRLRILANSDTPQDQALKRSIRDEVNKEITTWVKDLTSQKEAKKVIQSHLPDIEKIAQKKMVELNQHQSVKVTFGKVSFPTKLYGEYLYPAGDYPAVLITLGKGEGANWWCVLYPPLCFLDFSNGVAVSSPGFEDDKSKATSKRDKATVKQTAKTQSQPQEQTQTQKQKQTAAQSQEQTKTTAVQEKPQTEEKKVTNSTITTNQEIEPIETKTQKEEKTKAKESPTYVADTDDKPVKTEFFVIHIVKKFF